MENHQLKILRPSEGAKKLGLGRSTYYKLIKAGRIKQVRLGARAVGAFEHELDALLESLPRVG